MNTEEKETPKKTIKSRQLDNFKDSIQMYVVE